jgi:hypothetical protein
MVRLWVKMPDTGDMSTTVKRQLDKLLTLYKV